MKYWNWKERMEGRRADIQEISTIGLEKPNNSSNFAIYASDSNHLCIHFYSLKNAIPIYL